jgi:nitronate monooxygenase
MGGAVGPALAAAVSNAGGLGTLPLWSADIDTMRAWIRKTRSLTSNRLLKNGGVGRLVFGLRCGWR